MLRRLYSWILHWAETAYGTWALFLLSFCESSFFPIPPDILLIALSVAIPKKSFYYAFVCSAGSVLGGCLGYLIGWQFMAGIGEKIISFYGLTARVEYIQHLYMKYDALAIGVAGFTPIPYKVFTISAGALGINFSVFILASLISRSLRFFLVGWLIYRFGSGIQAFIEKYFNILAVVFTVLLVGGFVIIKYFF